MFGQKQGCLEILYGFLKEMSQEFINSDKSRKVIFAKNTELHQIVYFILKLFKKNHNNIIIKANFSLPDFWSYKLVDWTFKLMKQFTSSQWLIASSH